MQRCLQTIGAAAAFWVVMRRSQAPRTPRVAPARKSRFAASAFARSAAVVVALMLRAWAQTATAFASRNRLSLGCALDDHDREPLGP